MLARLGGLNEFLAHHVFNVGWVSREVSPLQADGPVCFFSGGTLATTLCYCFFSVAICVSFALLLFAFRLIKLKPILSTLV